MTRPSQPPFLQAEASTRLSRRPCQTVPNPSPVGRIRGRLDPDFGHACLVEFAQQGEQLLRRGSGRRRHLAPLQRCCKP